MTQFKIGDKVTHKVFPSHGVGTVTELSTANPDRLWVKWPAEPYAVVVAKQNLTLCEPPKNNPNREVTINFIRGRIESAEKVLKQEQDGLTRAANAVRKYEAALADFKKQLELLEE